MRQLVNDVAHALKCIDGAGVPFKEFQPGVDPYGEPQLLKKIVEQLNALAPDRYYRAATKRNPDILVPGRWGLEFKIARPFGDNGRPAEHWSQNLLHPYSGNVSAIGDALKLLESGIPERKGIIVIAFEHEQPQIDLEIIIQAFEAIARGVVRIPLGSRQSVRVTGLIHPVHQRAIVYGWELAESTN